MRFGVLGPPAVWASDGGPITVPGAKTRRLLAALLARGGRPVTADRLVEDLWGGAALPGDPAAALQTRVWQLRKALESAEPGGGRAVRLRPDGYALQHEPELLDSDRFAALTARAGAAEDPRIRMALLNEGLALWRGDAFAGFADTAFARPVAARLEEQRLAALEALAEARIASGEHVEAAGELRELVMRHPMRERLRSLQMRALHAAGRTDEALAAYQDLRVRLARELGLDPGPETTALHRRILEQGEPPPDTDARPRRGIANLPAPPTPLIGRDAAVTDVRRAFAAARHVTLTGPGGVGKTRLALEAAARLAPEFPDGTWLVELAALGRVRGASALDLVAETVMATLGVRDESGAPPAAGAVAPVERLVEAVRHQRLLLVLDNCEHLLDAVAALVLPLLRHCPDLRLLATSREPLGMLGEAVQVVPPLAVPGGPDGDRRPEAVARSSAVELFAARAAAASPGFALDAGNAADVADICRRLDGMPLALELAATRVRSLGVHAVAERLDDRFRLLATGYRGAPPRHRTLRATIDWSWDLLTEPERAVLRRLAVHADGCTLRSAEAVCAGGAVDADEVVDLVDRLVSCSLATVDLRGEEPRYRLLESVADYSRARLDESGERAAVLARHRRHYLDLTERAAPSLRGPGQARWLTLFDAEAANVRGALDDALRCGDAEDALRLVDAMSWYWFLRGRLREASRSLEAVLGAAAAAGPDSSPDSLRARAGAWRTGFAALVGERVERADLDRVTEALVHDVADPLQRARAQWFLGFALFGVGDQALSERLVAAALEAFEAAGDDWGTAAALSVSANQAHVRGDLDRLARDGRRSAALFAGLGDGWGRLQTVEPLAALAEMSGDYATAARLHREGLRTAEDLGLWPEASHRLASLGNTAMLTGDHEAARELHERARRLAAEHGFTPGQIHAEVGLGLAARREGRLDDAEARMRLVLELQAAYAFEPGRALALAELGFIAEQRGDADEALRLHSEGWSAAHRSGDPRAEALALEGLAGAHALASRHAYAAMLLGAASAARDAVGVPLPPAERGDVDRTADTVRNHLGEEAFHAAYRHGRGLAPEAALRPAPDWRP